MFNKMKMDESEPIFDSIEAEAPFMPYMNMSNDQILSTAIYESHIDQESELIKHQEDI